MRQWCDLWIHLRQYRLHSQYWGFIYETWVTWLVAYESGNNWVKHSFKYLSQNLVIYCKTVALLITIFWVALSRNIFHWVRTDIWNSFLVKKFTLFCLISSSHHNVWKLNFKTTYLCFSLHCVPRIRLSNCRVEGGASPCYWLYFMKCGPYNGPVFLWLWVSSLSVECKY